jgi:hypothetical protein
MVVIPVDAPRYHVVPAFVFLAVANGYRRAARRRLSESLEYLVHALTRDAEASR